MEVADPTNNIESFFINSENRTSYLVKYLNQSGPFFINAIKLLVKPFLQPIKIKRQTSGMFKNPS